MHPIIVLGTLLLSLTSTVHATTAQFITSTNALTKQADTIDAVVVALTPQTPLTTAQVCFHQLSQVLLLVPQNRALFQSLIIVTQQIPLSLQSLTAAIVTAITASTPTPPTSSPDTDFTVLDTYGLFANTIWELMDDYAYQKSNLIAIFQLKAAMHSQLTSFNTAFQV